MDEKVRKQKFLQLQFCMLLLVCTLLPDLGSLLGLPDFSVSVFCSQLVGVIGAGWALYAFYKSGPMPVPFLCLAGGGIVIGFFAYPRYAGLVGLCGSDSLACRFVYECRGFGHPLEK